MPAFKHRLGDRFNNLTLMGRMKKKNNWYWLVLCDCGALTSKRMSNIVTGKTTSCGNHGHGTGRREMDQLPSYKAAHYVVGLMRGKAAGYSCTDCGGPAAEWSYDGNDPDELRGFKNNTINFAYSLNVEHYEPRCVKCHRQYDAGLRTA